MKHNQPTRVMAIVLALLLCACDAQAVMTNEYFMEHWAADEYSAKKLYSFKKDKSDAYLAWNVYFGELPTYDSIYETVETEDGIVERYKENYIRTTDEQVFRAINLSNGKTKTFECPGYIIERDIEEYSGILFAEETEGILRITHMERNGTNEVVYEGEAPETVSIYGTQTVRAYMGGWLYYIKQVEDGKYQLFRKDGTGNEFGYDLTATVAGNPYFREYNGSVIDGYSIRPDGTVAWIWSPYSDKNADIYVQKPGEQKKKVMDREDLRKQECCSYWEDADDELDYSRISERALCWYDEKELLFFTTDWDVLELLKVNVDTGKIEYVKDSKGEKIQVDYVPPSIGTNVVLSPNKKCLAYICSATYWGIREGLKEVFTGCEEAPVVLDLTTGEIDYVYIYGSANADSGKDEWRVPESWRLVWHE